MQKHCNRSYKNDSTALHITAQHCLLFTGTPVHLDLCTWNCFVLPDNTAFFSVFHYLFTAQQMSVSRAAYIIHITHEALTLVNLIGAEHLAQEAPSLLGCEPATFKSKTQPLKCYVKLLATWDRLLFQHIRFQQYSCQNSTMGETICVGVGETGLQDSVYNIVT